MAQQIYRLSARTVQTICTKGRHADGGGLYLVVDKNAAKRWVFLYRNRRTHKLREMGLGGVAAVPLAKAREKAAEARTHLAAGRDPLAARRSSEGDDAEVGRSYGAVADALIKSMEPSWKNPKHRAQSELEAYARACLTIRDKDKAARPSSTRASSTSTASWRARRRLRARSAR
jgi:Arm DNA-binding domain